MDSIIAAVYHHAQQEQNRPAIFFANQTITYGQLYADIERVARALIAWGLQPGERVALFLDNCPAFVTAYLGTHLANGIVVPLECTTTNGDAVVASDENGRVLARHLLDRQVVAVLRRRQFEQGRVEPYYE